MNPDFWHRRWQKNEIGFHESEGSHLLKAYFDKWELPQKARVFVPLCGKTRDIAWLLNSGVAVVAIELNESAVIALFEDLGVKPNKVIEGNFIIYLAPDLHVFVGDFFVLTHRDISPIDGIYDRAALVALPQELRDQYTAHLINITNTTQQFLIAYDYDQSLFSGPPFSVTKAEVTRQYKHHYMIIQLYRNTIQDRFRGHDDVYEAAYLLKAFPTSTKE